MTTIERIKEIESFGNIDFEEKEFILRAFTTMRGIAIDSWKEAHHFVNIDPSEVQIDGEFEKRMKDVAN